MTCGPPSEAGAVHDTSTWASPTAAVSPVGAAKGGAVAGALADAELPGVPGPAVAGPADGTETSTGTDHVPWPTALTAAPRNQ